MKILNISKLSKSKLSKLSSLYIFYSYELHGKETSVKTAAKKRADQHVHPGRHISKFLARCLDSI